MLHQEFDPLSRITSQVGSAGSLPVAERRWHYDRNGDTTVMNESLWGESHFGYNEDGRLATASRQFGVSEQFLYDEAGEIASVRAGGYRESASKRPAMGTVELSFLSQGGRLAKVGESSYLYDADGRTTEKRVGDRVWRYEWTAEGQLRAVVTPDGERWTYEYDPFGRRTKKSGPRGTTVYVWDGVVVAQEIAPERTSAWLFEPGTFRPMAKVENGKAYACVTDQVGTPREPMTREGKLAWSARFTAFGELDTLKAKDTDCPIRFQGEWFDEERGLHYNFHRYYDPETGKYLSSDPIGLDGGTRSYGYVHNPLAWVDPFGLAGCQITDPNRLLPAPEERLALPAPRDSNPWMPGTPLESYPAPAGTNNNIAMSEGQPGPGGWGTTDNIPSVDYVRNDLAVTPQFKPNIASVQQYEVPAGTQIQVGTVGPQNYNGQVYPGGGSQVQILNYGDRASMIPIGPPTPIR